MRVRLLKTPAHNWSGHPWPAVGEVMEVDHPKLAAYMIAHGEAEAVREEPVEVAMSAPPENAARRVGRPKGKR